MKIKVDRPQEELPLLASEAAVADATPIQKAINQTFKSTAHLSNLLPTGSVMAFRLLSPLFTNGGDCDPAYRAMTASLVALCGLSCFLLCFTDSFRNEEGKVRYGFATLKGLWVIDGPVEASVKGEEYRLRPIDFAHALASLMVFAAVALLDGDTTRCFYPVPSEGVKEVLSVMPVGIGVVCSMFFVAFPTTRHGIGFPLSLK
ncbi:hypothetical protein QJS04_geneDACA022457 [Acorus gramineus]|uniref:Uncharacterized protein n=1 Tax=Acorus gramineus TaxID=55184 RepID=A0AAV9BI71_ACOGR|nr:hypothetical protein QJS04_geneDACA022457 [Acorus gramineus]